MYNQRYTKRKLALIKEDIMIQFVYVIRLVDTQILYQIWYINVRFESTCVCVSQN